MTDKRINYGIGILVFLTSLIIYIQTMAASVSFWDSGEFIACSYILGIPHSPGTPLYVLVGRVFTMLPLGISIAQKVNFLSALCGALGVLMAYMIMVELLRLMFGPMKEGLGKFIVYAGPVAGSMFLTFSDTYWWDSTEAEVYSLSAFVMGLCIVLALRWYRNPSGELGKNERRSIIDSLGGKEAEKAIIDTEKENRKHSRNLVFLIIYLLSLGIGFHLGTVLVYGGIFLLFLMVKKKAFSNFELLVFTFGMAVLVADMTLHKNSMVTVFGLIILAILLIWSSLSEGRFAVTATALFILGISVHLYLYIRSGLNPAIDEVDPETWRALYAHLRREQYPPMNVFQRKASLIWQFGHFWNYFREQFRMLGDVMLGPLNLGKAAVAAPMALGLYGIGASFSREKKSWMLVFTALLLNSIGLIIFLNFSDSEVRERDYFYGGAFYFFSIFIGVGASAFLVLVRDYFIEKGSYVKKAVVGAGILIIVLSILPARYHWFEHDRSNNFIARDYAYNMLSTLEPDAIIFTNGDNDTFPLWYIQTVEKVRNDVRVANLSLLQTAWYFKQLRDEEPKIPVDLTDAEVDNMHPVRLEDGTIAWRRDLATQHIIRSCIWKRPVYFAVTVPSELWKPYEENLEMEGMVRKIVPYKGDHLLNEFQMARNFDYIYRYRGVLTEDREVDDSVFKNDDTRSMFVNYAVASFQLAQARARDGDYLDASKWAVLSMKFEDSFEWAKKYAGVYFYRSGQLGKAVEHYESLIESNPSNGDYYTGLIAVYHEAGNFNAAINAVDRGIRNAPDERDLYGYGFRIAADMGQAALARSYVAKWLERHPDDAEFSNLDKRFDEIMQETYGLQPDSVGTEQDD